MLFFVDVLRCRYLDCRSNESSRFLAILIRVLVFELWSISISVAAMSTHPIYVVATYTLSILCTYIPTRMSHMMFDTSRYI
jgi:hypothetical protein